MTESGRDPLIRLPIDQEIYSEVVHDGEVVEDATVAAEVISLEREGAVYEIEGAIVFAGYVRTRADTSGNVEGTPSESQSSDVSNVEHVHHRLPFRLRVPVAAQPQGVLNIKSRLSQFQASIVSDNWLNLRGNLEIHGLHADAGYHFRCGVQEEGNAFFVDDDPPSTSPRSSDGSDATAGPSASDSAQDRTELVGSADGWRFAPGEDADQAKGLDARATDEVEEEDNRSQSLAEKVSEGRGGHDWAEEESHAEDHTRVSAQETVKPIRDELANLDRHFVKRRTDETPDQAERVQHDHSTTEPIASFEFEHEIEEEVAQEQRKKIAVEHERDMVRTQSENEDGDWRPHFTIAGSVKEKHFLDASVDEDMTERVEELADSNANRQEAVPSSVTDSDLWAFVDFNGPEPRHTMRYVIVMEEESIETVSERCGCLTSELRRANRLDDDQVRPGQALYIPSQPYAIPKISVS